MDADAVSNGGAVVDGDEGHSEPLVTQQMRKGLESLWRAAQYAQNAGVDLWTFAVEFAELRAAGLCSSDLRWLIAKGYVEQASEIDAESPDRRRFEKQHRFRFNAASCFVLTRLGLEFVRLVLFEPLRAASPESGIAPVPAPSEAEPAGTPANGSDEDCTPRWDVARRELWVGRTLVKRFRVPAPHQELVLTVFQEDGWPRRIDDPLPPHPAIDTKRQLHATISSLNRHQKQPLIHFSGDGTGTGVLWELTENGNSASD